MGTRDGFDFDERIFNSVMPSVAAAAGLNDIADAVRSAAEVTTELGDDAAEVLQSFADAAERFPADVEQYLASVVADEDVKEALSGSDTPDRDVSEGIALLVLLGLLGCWLLYRLPYGSSIQTS